MGYLDIRHAATLLVEQADTLQLSAQARSEIEFLKKLLGDFSLANEITRLQVFIRGEGEVPEFDAAVEGQEDRIQADGIYATVMSIASRYREEDRPAAIEKARRTIVENYVSNDLWGPRIIALADQEKEIEHRLEHGLTMAYN